MNGKVVLLLPAIAIMFLLFACNGTTTPSKTDSTVVAGMEGSYRIYIKNHKAGMVDNNGRILLPAQFDYIEDYSYDHLVLVDSGGHHLNQGDAVGYVFKKYGIVTDKGHILFRPMFDGVFISDHMIRVKVDSLYGYTTDKGVWVVKPKYKEAYPFDRGAAVVKVGARYTLIDKAGQPFTHRYFDAMGDLHNGVSTFFNQGKSGFINYKGQVLLQGIFGTGDYNWNYGKIFKGQKTYLIDTLGKVYKTGFDTVETYEGKNNTTVAKGKINGKAIEIVLN
jgi:hypothetical protein